MKCSKDIQVELKAKLQRLWNCETRLEAEQYIERLYNEYYVIPPKAIECLLHDRDNLFRYLSFPMNHRNTIHITILIELIIKRSEIKDKSNGQCT